MLQRSRDAIGKDATKGDAAGVGVCKKLSVVTSLAMLGQCQQEMLEQQGVTSPDSFPCS